MTARLEPLCRAIVGGLLAMLVLGLWGASPASAADAGPENAAIDNALPEKGAVRLLVSVPGDAGSTSTASRSPSTGRTSTPRRWPHRRVTPSSATSILAIDTSDSMRGARIAEAKKAALTYLATVPGQRARSVC